MYFMLVQETKQTKKNCKRFSTKLSINSLIPFKYLFNSYLSWSTCINTHILLLFASPSKIRILLTPFLCHHQTLSSLHFALFRRHDLIPSSNPQRKASKFKYWFSRFLRQRLEISKGTFFFLFFFPVIEWVWVCLSFKMVHRRLLRLLLWFPV